jgi:hypothetical protein
MNWDVISAIAEIIGSIGILVTLAYLSLQIRQSNRQENIKGLQDAISVFVASVVRLTESEESAEIFRKGIHNFLVLSVERQAQFHSKLLNLIAGFSQVSILHQSGLLDDSEFEAMQCTMLSIFRSPGALQWWESWKHNVPVPLQEYLNKAIPDSLILAQPASEHWIGFTSAE